MMAVLLLFILLFAGLLFLFRYPLLRIWSFQRRRYRFSSLRSDPLRRFRRRRYEVSLPELRDFASSVLLGTSMKATLAQALQRTADQFKRRGIFGERLNRHVEARVAESPEAVLRGLIQDFKSNHLEDMLRRIEISRKAGGSLVDALALSVDALEEDIRSGISREIRESANQLTIPMIMGVFFSVAVLGIVPMILILLQRLSG